MILLGLGANLPSERCGPPRQTLCTALELLDSRGVRIIARSRWFESAPVPASDQPWFVNGVAHVDTALEPGALLEVLHEVEAAVGRVRGPARNAPRAADLDLLDHDGRVTGEGAWPRLPHPRMHERAFVLRPLAELAPQWRHPLLGESAEELLGALGGGQACRPLA